MEIWTPAQIIVVSIFSTFMIIFLFYFTYGVSQLKPVTDVYRKKVVSEDERSCINLQIVPQNRTGRSNVSYVREKIFDEDCLYEELIYERSLNDPNFNFSLGDFVKVCKNLSAIKCETVCILCYQNEIVLKAETEGKVSGHMERIGAPASNVTKDLKDIITYLPEAKLDDRPVEVMKLKVGRAVITEIHVPRSIIKGLAQMNNICTGGTIKFYIEPDRPIRLVCPIGHYGTLTVHLRGITRK